MLDDAAIARYARQIVVPGIGAAGQERLLASTVLVVGHPRGCATAALYLAAAGVRVVEDIIAADVVVVANAATLDAEIFERLAAGPATVCWYDAKDGGFDSGIHPRAPLPRPSGEDGNDDGVAAVHDAAACDAAALACAILSGLEVPSGPFRLR